MPKGKHQQVVPFATQVCLGLFRQCPTEKGRTKRQSGIQPKPSEPRVQQAAIAPWSVAASHERFFDRPLSRELCFPVDRSCQSRGTKLVVDAPVCGEQNTSPWQSTGARGRILRRESCFSVARYHHSRRSSFMLPSSTDARFLANTVVVVSGKLANANA